MAIVEVKREHTANVDAIDDPKIIKVAKLTLILADKDTDEETKLGCLRLAVRMGYITEEERTQLLMYREELEDFM